MNKLITIPTMAMLLFNICYASDEYMEKYDRHNEQNFTNINNLKSDPLYTKVCGSCHMAYQAEFLPRRSWKKIIETLQDHFGKDVTIATDEKRAILKHLMDNAADRKRIGIHFTALAGSIAKGEIPLRMSQTQFFVKTHSKLTKEQIDQPAVKSVSNCNACHKKAEQGDYRKRTINIPNYGPWKD